MIRYHDWQKRLQQFLDAKKESGFVWGKNDCCLFACGAIAAMTGTDPGVAYRGKYRDEDGGNKMLHWFFDGSVEGAAEKGFRRANMPSIPVGEAKPGDIVMFRRMKPMLGVVDFDMNIDCPGSNGLFKVRLKNGMKAWRV